MQKVDGAKLLLSGGYLGIVGWTEADQVIRVDRAIRYFSDQIREHPNDTFARVMRAQLWLDRGELDEAMADCDEAIRIDPRYCPAYETRADIWLRREDVDRSLADCETALRLDPQSASAHVRRGDGPDCEERVRSGLG